VQISFSETSINNAVQNAPAVNNNARAVQQQVQESSLSYQLDLTEISTNYAIQSGSPNVGGTASGQPQAGNQPSPSGAQQLIGLVAQSLQNAAQTAQVSGSSAVANLLTQLAAYFKNALDAAGQANAQGASDSTGAANGGQGYFPAAGGDSYGGSSGSQAGSSSGSQQALQQLQESLLSYQIDFSESSTNGNATSQEAFSLSATSLSLSAVF
jgi:hypothetical protein